MQKPQAHTKKRKLFLFFPFVLIGFLLSCKNIPHYPNAVFEESKYIPLEAGALAYVLADVQASRPILELIPIQGLDNKQLREMINRTKSLAAALYPPESSRRFQLTAWGTYPHTGAGIAFAMNREWEKRRSTQGLPYWYSATNGLSASLNRKQAFVVSSADGGEPFTVLPGVGLPEGFGEFRRGAVIACWLENPGSVISRIFAQMEIPLQIPADRIFISLFPVSVEGAELQYQGLIRVETPGSGQARSLVAILNLARSLGTARLYPQPESSVEANNNPDFTRLLVAVLLANTPVQDDKNLNIKTALLNKTEAALLFNFFSLYLSHQL